MAVGDLRKLLEDTRDLLMQDTEWYRTFLNIQAHTYTNSVKNVQTQLIGEIGGDLYRDNKQHFDKMIATYVATLYERIVKTKRNAYEIVEHPGSSPSKFTVDIIPKKMGSVGAPRKSGSTLIYESVGPDPFKRIINVEKRAALKPLLDEINGLLNTNLTTSTFLDTGHTEQGVVERQVNTALATLRGSIESRDDLTELAKASGVLARLKLTSTWTGPSKNFTITVTDESYKANRSKATGEKAFKASTMAALEKLINRKDWFNQKGSDSFKEAAFAELDKAVKQSGGIVKNPRKSNKTAGTVTTNIKFNAANSKIKDGGFIAKATAGQVKKPDFDMSVINIINSQLPPAVRANMGYPALVNRTGRFSESARIIGVEQTAQGYPSLVYTYQRSPYDVFDPTIGRSPWATPDRDPKVIITRAIRDIARDMAIGRFYMRRA